MLKGEPDIPLPYLFIYLIAYSTIVFFSLRRSYEYKRELFLPGVTYLESRGLERRGMEKRGEIQVKRLGRGTNVYELEDQLFSMLGVAKPQEPRMDIWFQIIAVIMFAVGAILVLLPVVPRGVSVLAALSVPAGMCVLLAILLIAQAIGKLRRRKYR